jgi:predicted nucleotidyltransferase
MDMDIVAIVPELLMKHPAVKQVALAGSRLRGDATEWSDWDFSVETTDFEAVSAALPTLTESLSPLTHLWDPLSRHTIYMMILKGPIKVDLMFNRLQQQKPPWIVNGDTLAQVNSHFWDWILWIAGKEVSGKKDASKELEKMYDFLLAPLGCAKKPNSVEEAVRDYLAAFKRQRNLLHIEIDPALEVEVIKGLKKMAYN